MIQRPCGLSYEGQSSEEVRKINTNNIMCNVCMHLFMHMYILCVSCSLTCICVYISMCVYIYIYSKNTSIDFNTMI